jgi:thiamine transport system substrate-binding protein
MTTARVAALFLVLNSWVMAAPLKVLTYNSMVGKKSYGEWLAKAFADHCKCEIKFVTNTGASSLLGKLRLEATKKSKAIDVVLGLSQYEKNSAKALGLINESALFDQSPMVILADRKKLPTQNLKMTWAELAKGFAKQVLVQDPRLSALGAAWLSTAFVDKRLGLDQLTKLQARVYPSWSTSYAAFSQGEAPLIWTLQTSEAYHLCQGGEEADRFRALDLAEAYPVHREYVAAVTSDPRAKKFLDFVVSREAQTEIPLRNWMLPARKDVVLPACFAKMTPVKFSDIEVSTSQTDVDEWISAWSAN